MTLDTDGKHTHNRWWESYFGDDYFVLYRFDAETTRRECEFLCHELGLALGMRVLDLCCGYGRHMGHLLRRGIDVIGLDLERVQLAKAKKRLGVRGLPHGLVQGDMRFLPFSQGFDAALSMFTSFGYFNDDGNTHVLSELHRTLRPGGRLLLDLPNVVASCRRGLAQQWVERESSVVFEEFERDACAGRLLSRKVVADGEGRRPYRFAFREYTLREITAMLQRVGFEFEGARGGYEATPLMPDSPRMIVKARREGRASG